MPFSGPTLLHICTFVGSAHPLDYHLNPYPTLYPVQPVIPRKLPQSKHSLLRTQSSYCDFASHQHQPFLLNVAPTSILDVVFVDKGISERRLGPIAYSAGYRGPTLGSARSRRPSPCFLSIPVIHHVCSRYPQVLQGCPRAQPRTCESRFARAGEDGANQPHGCRTTPLSALRTMWSLVSFLPDCVLGWTR